MLDASPHEKPVVELGFGQLGAFSSTPLFGQSGLKEDVDSAALVVSGRVATFVEYGPVLEAIIFVVALLVADPCPEALPVVLSRADPELVAPDAPPRWWYLTIQLLRSFNSSIPTVSMDRIYFWIPVE